MVPNENNLYQSCFMPKDVIDRFLSITPGITSEKYALTLLKKSYRTAFEKNTIKIEEDYIAFPTGRNDNEKKPIFLVCIKDEKNQEQPFTAAYIGTDPDTSVRELLNASTATLEGFIMPANEHNGRNAMKIEENLQYDEGELAGNAAPTNMECEREDSIEADISEIIEDIRAFCYVPPMFINKLVSEVAGIRDTFLAWKLLQSSFRDAQLKGTLNYDHDTDVVTFPLCAKDRYRKTLYVQCSLNRNSDKQKWAISHIGHFEFPESVLAPTASEIQATPECDTVNEERKHYAIDDFGFAPLNTINLLIAHHGLSDENSAVEYLDAAYRAALESGEVKTDSTLRVVTFPLGKTDGAGKPIYVLGKPNSNIQHNPAPWALTYIGSNPMIGTAKVELEAAINNELEEPLTLEPAATIADAIKPEHTKAEQQEFQHVRRFCGLRKEAYESLKGNVESVVSKESAWQVLQELYVKSRNEGTLVITDTYATFQVFDDIYVLCHKNSLKNQQPWIATYVGKLVKDENGEPIPYSKKKSAPKAAVNSRGDQPQKQFYTGQRFMPGRALETWAYMGRWEDTLDALESLASPEPWDFKGNARGDRFILLQYLKYTFFRLEHEGKICIKRDAKGSGVFAAFNTGLFTRNYDDIYACFEPSKDGFSSPWRFKSFCIAGVDDGKALLQHFRNPPEPARYFESYQDLFYDVDLLLYTDYNHIILDHPERLPMEFIRNESNDRIVEGIIGDLRGTQDVFYKRSLYNKLSDYLRRTPPVFNRLRNRIKDSIELSLKRTRWNYQTAVPMYHPARNAMSLMLPLCLQNDSTTDVALVVQYNPIGNYQGQTVLSLSMAYLDARQICQPNSDWLNPGNITPYASPDEVELDEEY